MVVQEVKPAIQQEEKLRSIPTPEPMKPEEPKVLLRY